MAEWLKRRNKIRNVFGLIKDQTAASLARASGTFGPLQIAVVMATNHDENLPEEKYVEEILAAGSGSRLKVSYCTRALVKRLTKTQSWAVAIKCLVVLHRTILDGGFLFQDQLTFFSSREGRDYLNFANVRHDLSPLEWELSSWVRLYAKYLDERLICSRVLKCHFDSKWSGAKIQNRVPYRATEDLLNELVTLQNLLHELCLCQVGPEAGENSVVQGALVLVAVDSYKLQEEIRSRIQEMLERVGNLQLSEGLGLLQICKRADIQMKSLQKYIGRCKELSLLSDLPLPEKEWVSESDMERLTETIKTPSAPLYTKRSVSSGGRMLGGESTLLTRTASGFTNREGQGVLQRTTSQPMSQPRQLRESNEKPPRASPYSDANLHGNLSLMVNSCPDLIDLSCDTKLPSVGEGSEVSVPSRHMTVDLITWSEPTPQAMPSTDWENILLDSMSNLSMGASQTSINPSHNKANSFSGIEPRFDEDMYRRQGLVNSTRSMNNVDNYRLGLLGNGASVHVSRLVPAHLAYGSRWPAN